MKLITLLESGFDWDSLRHVYSFKKDHEQHRIDLSNSQGAVGYVEWCSHDGEIMDIFVGDRLRRLGIGTHLWELACEMSEENGWPAPEHSSRRTRAGHEFAKSVGGYLPDVTDDVNGWTREVDPWAED